jgi:hypothetical protein
MECKRTWQSRSYLFALVLVIALVCALALAGCRPTGGNTRSANTAGGPEVVKEIPTLLAPTEVPPTTRPPAPEPAGDPDNEALAYPGASPMELSDMANKYCLDALKTGLPAPPVGVPDGTRGIFSYTSDETALVKEHYAAALPASGWTDVRQWEILGTYATSWSQGSDRLVMVIMDNFSEAALAPLKDQFGMAIPLDHRLIVAWPWEEGAAAVTGPDAPALAGDPGAEALVYPGSTALEPSPEGQEYFEGIWEGDLQTSNLRVPDGATADFAYTHDTLEQVQAYYDAGLPAAGWEPVRNGIGMNAWGYLWKMGEANLMVLYITNFSEEHLTWFADTFDIHLPDRGVVLITTYVW